MVAIRRSTSRMHTLNNSRLQAGPSETVVAALDEPVANPERVWTSNMATSTAAELAYLSSNARQAQVSAWPEHPHRLSPRLQD